MNSHAEAALSRPSVSRRAVASRSASMGSTSAASSSRPPSVDGGSRLDLPKRARFARSYRRVALAYARLRARMSWSCCVPASPQQCRVDGVASDLARRTYGLLLAWSVWNWPTAHALTTPPPPQKARAPRSREISASESHGGARENSSKRLVVPVDVEHGRLVLVGACGDQEIRDRYTMLTVSRQLTLSGQRDRDRLGVHSELMERVELDLELLVGAS